MILGLWEHWEKRWSQNSALWGRFWKMVPYFVKKAPKQFPYGKVPPPPPKGHRFPKKGLFRWGGGHFFRVLEKGTVFVTKKGRKWCPFGAPFWCFWTKGTVFAAKKSKKWCRLVKGHYISALGALFLYGKDRQNRCPFHAFAKGHQNSAPKGTVLRTIKRSPKGTILVSNVGDNNLQHIFRPKSAVCNILQIPNWIGSWRVKVQKIPSEFIVFCDHFFLSFFFYRFIWWGT